MNEKKMEFITLKNNFLEVTFSNLGASLYRVKFLNDDMVVTPKDEKDFLNEEIYYGKTIGRVCGRIDSHPFELEGEKYHPQGDKNFVSLHGGKDKISKKFFDYEVNGLTIKFSCLAKDGEGGYPGNLYLDVIYELKDNQILLSFVAHSDKPTLLALTNHAYFTLDESHVSKLYLKLPASKYIKTNDVLMPSEMVDVDDKFDFSKRRLIDVEIDNYFHTNREPIELYSPRYSLKIESNFEGAVIFTDHFKDDVKTLLSNDDVSRSVAIEPQDNQLDRKVLSPNEIYERHVVYTFKKL